jgi:putative spermidine/putrescine transport system ATP-binding protein
LVELSGVAKVYSGVEVLHAVDLVLRDGEFMTVLGPSGSGKTTVLRLIGGLVHPTRGKVLLDGSDISAMPINRRPFNTVFQDYALFPHMTVEANVGYGLKVRGESRARIQERVIDTLRLVALEDFAGRYPSQLSGGQQQRVALARALAVEPSVLLLDEPFSALDKNLRLDMQIELKRLQRQLGLTAILVTHDQDEAMGVADRIAVMNAGRVEQLDTPVKIYDRPASLFVSGFIGTTNHLSGRVVQLGERVRVALDVGGTVPAVCNAGMSLGDPVTVTVRPEQLELFPATAADRWPVRHRLSVPSGAQVIHELEAAGFTIMKVIAPRIGPLADEAQAKWCGLRTGAVPTAFPKPKV